MARALAARRAAGQVQLICAPLYHNSPFLSSYGGLADDHTLVVMEKFDAATRCRGDRALSRQLRLHAADHHAADHDAARRRERDFSSIQAMHRRRRRARSGSSGAGST